MEWSHRMTQANRAHGPRLAEDDPVSDHDYHNRVFDEMSLNGRDLQDCSFIGCSFVNANLTGARLNASILRDCNLSNARIAGCNMFATAFESCKMMGVDFQEGVN